MSARWFTSEAENSADEARLEAGLQRAVPDSLGPASPMLFLGMTLLAISHLIFLPPEIAPALTLSTTACALFFLTAYLVIRRGSVTEQASDPQRLHQVLRNLLSYAAGATQNGVVRLTAQKETDPDGRSWVVYEISDDGPGLPDELAAGLFEPFPTQELEQALRFSGPAHNQINVGLAISQRLCRIMGGDLSAQSAPGAGTTFIARLPAE